MTDVHPFSPFIAALGRGKTKSRPLTQEESRQAMGMILRGEVLPEQVGAFMMLQRYKEETPEEVAGFVQAVRDELQLPGQVPQVDLDWSSYAGKRRQLPWFILSVLVLAQNGVRVFMHGTEGHTPGRVYTKETLHRLGFPTAGSLEEAGEHLDRFNLAYVPLEVLSGKLRELIDLRPIFGLRSPVHTLARMINPFEAPAMLQGIFHRGFMETHTEAGRYLEQPHMAVFRGEGGEIERRPNKPTEVWTLHEGKTKVERWPVLMDDPRAPADEEMNTDRLEQLWTGAISDAYGEAAVTGTLAIALKLLGKAPSMEAADKMARDMWESRDRTPIFKAA